MSRIQSRVRAPFNYLYFAFLFAVLVSLHLYQLSFLPAIRLSSLLFLTFTVIAECAVEVLFLVFIYELLRKTERPLLIRAYRFFCLLLVLIQVIDFMILRFFDLTVWHALYSYLFLETLENFIILLYASDISLSKWIASGLAILCLPILALWFYRLTHRLSKKKPLVLRSHRIGYSLFFLMPALLAWDLLTAHLTDFSFHDGYRRLTPWKQTFFYPKKEVISLKGEFKPPPTEKAAAVALLKLGEEPLVHQPNIVLFVAESLRRDFIDEKTAPHLDSFKKEFFSSEHPFAGGNCTPLGWYSLFHSQFPLFWGEPSINEWKMGSPTLALLKEKGYKIRVYTSARLSYYKMDELMFGANCNLVEKLHFFPYADEIKPWQSDLSATEKLCEDLSSAKEGGNLFIVFLDSTHFHYSWPESDSPFTPFCEKISYLNAICKKRGIEEIKNRYRNAIHFVDTLFGKVKQALLERNLWDDAIVFLCGDHGEEFLEKNNLFHASALSQEQTETVLLCKFGNHKTLPEADRFMFSQIDLFPSLLHFLFGTEVLKEFHQGESIFAKERSHFALTARYNCAKPAEEFALHNGKEKIILRYLNKAKKEGKLLLLSHSETNDKQLTNVAKEIEKSFAKGLEKITTAPTR